MQISDFILKLHKYSIEKSLTITSIKKTLPNESFVDYNRHIIRVKFRDEWTVNVFEKDENVIKWVKLVLV